MDPQTVGHGGTSFLHEHLFGEGHLGRHTAEPLRFRQFQREVVLPFDHLGIRPDLVPDLAGHADDGPHLAHEFRHLPLTLALTASPTLEEAPLVETLDENVLPLATALMAAAVAAYVLPDGDAWHTDISLA